MSDNRKEMNPFGYALLGALVGGLAMFFIDKNKRESFRRKVSELLEEGDNKISDVGSRISDAAKKGKRKLAQKLEETEEKLNNDMGV